MESCDSEDPKTWNRWLSQVVLLVLPNPTGARAASRRLVHPHDVELALRCQPGRHLFTAVRRSSLGSAEDNVIIYLHIKMHETCVSERFFSTSRSQRVHFQAGRDALHFDAQPKSGGPCPSDGGRGAEAASRTRTWRGEPTSAGSVDGIRPRAPLAYTTSALVKHVVSDDNFK